jgi:uncharacterized protein YndB with AHSA1/START domain
MAQAPDQTHSAELRNAEPVTLEIRRIFDAPRELVWDAWTKAEMTAQWLGPVEWPASCVNQDLRVGGAWNAVLTSTDGKKTLSQRGAYRVIDPPKHLVFTFAWGNGHEDGPSVETLVEIQLSEISDHRTQMIFTQTCLKSAASTTGHRHGWTSSFDRLDKLLADTPNWEA